MDMRFFRILFRSRNREIKVVNGVLYGHYLKAKRRITGGEVAGRSCGKIN